MSISGSISVQESHDGFAGSNLTLVTEYSADPLAAVLMVPGATVGSAPSPDGPLRRHVIDASGRADLVIQCFQQGGAVPMVFNAGDQLSAAWYPIGNMVSLFRPTMQFFTNNGTQSGYQQGQIQASLSTQQAPLMFDGLEYLLEVWRAPSGNPTNFDPIARLLFVASSPWQP